MSNHIIQNNFSKRSKANKNFVEKDNFYISSNDLVFLEVHPNLNRKRTPVAGDNNRFQSQESL